MPREELFEEYLEIALLLSAFTWFSAVFPLGGVLALAHAIAVLKTRRLKLFFAVRRKMEDDDDAVMVDATLKVLEAISFVGVICSIALLQVATPNGWSMGQLWCVEHLLLFFKAYLSMVIGAEPQWLRNVHHHVSEALERRILGWSGQRLRLQSGLIHASDTVTKTMTRTMSSISHTLHRDEISSSAGRNGNANCFSGLLSCCSSVLTPRRVRP